MADNKDKSRDVPLHLSHKICWALPYEKYDGARANDTDMRFLSIGLSQWDPSEVSLKTMRYVGTEDAGKWSRMSEELPVNRVVDLCIFLAYILYYRDTNEDVDIPSGTFWDQKEDTKAIRTVDKGHLTTKEKHWLREFLEGGSEERKIVNNRLTVLTDILIQLREEGKV